MECMKNMTGIYVIEKGSVQKTVKQYFRMFRNLIPPSFLITDSNDKIVETAVNRAVEFAAATPGEFMQLRISSCIHSEKDEGTDKNYAAHKISSTTARGVGYETLIEEF